MKRTLLIFTLILTAVLNIGCSKKSPEVTLVTTGLIFNLEYTAQNTNFKYNVKIDEKGDFTATVLEPENLKGYVIKTENGKFLGEFKGLSAEVDGGAVKTIYNCFNTAKNSAASEENGEYKISGKADFSFNLYLGQTGLPLKLETDLKDVFYFKNVTLVNQKVEGIQLP